MRTRNLVIEDARARPDAHETRCRAVRDEHPLLREPAQPSAALRMQVHRGRKTSGGQDEIAVEPFGTRTGRAVSRRHLYLAAAHRAPADDSA
ncbi:MAG TPA: hypothetical protein VFO23_14995, partial [Steroidobacteraceae bacterium]|nr:hypothetical protein [Steroidobacteraceae bacterium]